MKSATLIKADGTEQEVSPENGHDFSLEELQGFVGGLIEMAKASDGRVLVINEEGKLLNLPVNAKATELYAHKEQDVIVGDALVADQELVS